MSRAYADTMGTAPWSNTVVVSVVFEEGRSSKAYNYFARGDVPYFYDEQLFVSVVFEEGVRVRAVRPARPHDRFKTISADPQHNLKHNLPPERVRAWFGGAEPLYTPTTEATEVTHTEDTTVAKPISIKITKKTLINDVDITEYRDEELIALIAQAEQEIRALEAIENKPQRLVKRISDLRQGLQDLVALVDSVG